MQFGGHVSSSGGINTAIDRAEDIGANAVQVFTQSPRMWRPTNHKPESVARFRERREEAGVESVVCHATYLINLGATDDVIYHKSVKALATTVDVADQIGAESVIFHVGSHLGRGLDAAMHQIVPGIEIACAERRDEGPWLLLENSAGHQGTIGVTMEELALVIDELGRPDRIGICLDTCHLFASGIDITEPAAVDELLDEIDERIGLEKLRALHINDSKMPFGSNRDRHANVGTGEIGDGLAVILGHPRLQHLPAIAETPGAEGHGVDVAEISSLQRLHKKGVEQWRTVTSSK
ncbi:MAG: deoxyribonuclease [Gaiellales bacterium]|jgi:deoxyribonuclease-4|nr:deoxyribonuclease [Gaiellales bacterium]